jgi:hypothetical protein
MNNYAPIACFAYNRPNHLNNLLSSLIKNPEATFTKIFFFIDYPRNLKDKILVDSCVQIAENYRGQFNNFELVLRSINFGCKLNIISGVNQVLSESETIIILEDDLIVSETFLHYMNTALQKYRKSNVFHISGYNFFNDSVNPGSSYITGLMNCWGWGTWDDKWLLFSENYTNYNFTKDNIFKFNMNGSHNFYNQLLENKNGVINTWAIFWYSSIFNHGGVCLNPTTTLTINMGEDGSGERVGSNSHIKELCNIRIINYPLSTKINNFYDEIQIKYFESRKTILKTYLNLIFCNLPAGGQKFIRKCYFKIQRILK